MVVSRECCKFESLKLVKILFYPQDEETAESPLCQQYLELWAKDCGKQLQSAQDYDNLFDTILELETILRKDGLLNDPIQRPGCTGQTRASSRVYLREFLQSKHLCLPSACKICFVAVSGTSGGRSVLGPSVLDRMDRVDRGVAIFGRLGTSYCRPPVSDTPRIRVHLQHLKLIQILNKCAI